VTRAVAEQQLQSSCQLAKLYIDNRLHIQRGLQAVVAVALVDTLRCLLVVVQGGIGLREKSKGEITALNAKGSSNPVRY